ncbi:MAG: hypothetical protein U1E22_04475, partial [Coriobacteriia bacterium]|nr:hypothetical protein [Coriobacteriia bacterium]
MAMKLPQPERSGGTNALLAALVVASLVITTVYYREGDDGLLHRVRRGTEALTAPVSAAGEWATGPLRATGKWFSGLSVSKEEYNTLKTQNVELRSRVAELEEARLENERLRDLVGFIEARKLEGLGARVIGRPASAWEGVITIDRGS